MTEEDAAAHPLHENEAPALNAVDVMTESASAIVQGPRLPLKNSGKKTTSLKHLRMNINLSLYSSVVVVFYRFGPFEPPPKVEASLV